MLVVRFCGMVVDWPVAAGWKTETRYDPLYATRGRHTQREGENFLNLL